jgi:hypothetical protein
MVCKGSCKGRTEWQGGGRASDRRLEDFGVVETWRSRLWFMRSDLAHGGLSGIRVDPSPNFFSNAQHATLRVCDWLRQQSLSTLHSLD